MAMVSYRTGDGQRAAIDVPTIDEITKELGLPAWDRAKGQFATGVPAMEHIENQFAEQFRKKPAPDISADIRIVRIHATVARDNARRAGREDAARSLDRVMAILHRMIEIETEHEEASNG